MLFFCWLPTIISKLLYFSFLQVLLMVLDYQLDMKGIINYKSSPGFLVKQIIRQSVKFSRVATVKILNRSTQLLPNFIIIGAQRAGTSSLYNYLVKHPSVICALTKEIHFFDVNFQKGVTWYRSHFPSFLYKYCFERIYKSGLVTGEASPYYIFHPRAAERILKVVPGVKLIILLRNPVDRAYSHYIFKVRRGYENLFFEEAMKKEGQRLGGEIEKMFEDENYHSFNHRHYSYLSRGIYVDQLKVWMSLFPENQILILRSENLFSNPPSSLKQVLRFLNLPSWELTEYKIYNAGNYPKMNNTTRKHLINYFKPHNQRLYEYLGKSFDWGK